MDDSNLAEQRKLGPTLSNSNRRRFVRGVGLAAPVILTVSARSALACHCTSVSAAGSIALQNSHNAKADVWQRNKCDGYLPSRWKVNLGGTVIGKNVPFESLFPGSGLDAGVTIKQILKETVASNEMVKIFAAAYLNSTTGKIGEQYYTVDKLKQMWVGRNGSFEPVPGKLWGWDDIRAYLLPTMY